MAGGLRDHLCGFQLMHVHAFSRRCIGVVLAICGLLALIFAAPVKAQDRSCSNSPTVLTSWCTDEGKAFAAANATASAQATLSNNSSPGVWCPGVARSGQNAFTAYVTPCNSPGPQWETRTRLYDKDMSCKNRPDYNGAFPGSQYKPRSGSVSCDLGCTVMWTHNADGTVNGSPIGDTCTAEDHDSDDDCKVNGPEYYYNRQIGVCEPQEPECKGGAKANSLGKCEPEPCPDGMAQQQDGTCKKKNNECPAGQVRSPDGKCLPGDGQCASGEVRGPDGTCKKDGDGDGQPDDPGENETFSGGDDCSVPPSCSGSPILCGQARIQWRIDCNTRRNRNIAGGACNTMPICTGDKCDAMEYAGLLMQWRSTCALEKMASSGNGGSEGGDVKAIRDALTGTGGAVTTPADRPASDVWTPSSGQPTRPDSSGYGWGRGCPQPPAIEVMGQTIAFDITPLCRWLGLGSYFVVGLAALFCLRIIASRDA
ncbi:virulence factor TspB C-terminal domain-related protein [Stenotrophomonas pavanii]|uniref:virulence factor TspB C-terminal domain-related protein n=1 Tax=Bacteria TaxID=2 RepID=UPI001CC5979D|nr:MULTISPECIES: virulence factor TspB C-terminal domain-related protein [Bacteria]MCU1122531.1 hypothetical protein [Stenotrophomonas maltophilia]MDQ7278918.1 virulence factor TspB C-terminal domain-related protein [Stenotrophomonas sp. Sm3147]